MDILKLSTDWAKSFIWPLFIASLLITLVGAGLFFANNPRIDRFQQEYRLNPDAFAQSEIQRTEKSKGELALVFRIIPLIIVLSAAVILMVSGGAWRAIAVTVIINAAFLMIVDSNTEARNNIYHYEISTLKK